MQAGGSGRVRKPRRTGVRTPTRPRGGARSRLNSAGGKRKRWICASAAPPLPKITLWRPGRAQLLPTFQAKCNARTVGMSAPFMIRPDTNQVCKGLAPAQRVPVRRTRQAPALRCKRCWKGSRKPGSTTVLQSSPCSCCLVLARRTSSSCLGLVPEVGISRHECTQKQILCRVQS